MIKAIVTSIIYCLIPLHIFAQDYFTVDRHRNVEIKEAYDGGYLLLSDESSGSEPSHITKLSLKGDVLWDIALEPDYGALLTTSMEIDAENNIYIAGNTGRHDTTFGDSFTLKISPCGELVWIHFYGYRDYWDIVRDLNISDDQALFSIYDQLYGIQDESGGLVTNPGKLRQAKLNLDGDTIWSSIWPVVTGVDEHREVIATNDGGSLVSMESYFSYQGSPYYIRPTFMKLDINGEVEWIERIGVEDGILGQSFSAVELDDGNFACVLIQRFPGFTGYFPLFFAKLSPEGEVLDLHQLSDEGITNNGGIHMLMNNENELFVTTARSTPENVNSTHFKLYKLDTDGNILNSYINETVYVGATPYDICENGDILIALQASSIDEPDNIHIYRFDGETLDPIPVPEEDNNEYDTLCPEGIAMSEYSFPTVEDLGQSQVSISNGMAFQLFPNPVKDKFSLNWTSPQNESTESWMLECHDIFGRLIYTKKISPKNRSLEVNTSTWNHGLYIMTIKNNKEIIYQHKLVK